MFVFTRLSFLEVRQAHVRRTTRKAVGNLRSETPGIAFLHHKNVGHIEAVDLPSYLSPSLGSNDFKVNCLSGKW